MRGSVCTEDSFNTQFMCIKGQEPAWGFRVFCRVLRGEYRHINVCSLSSSGTWYFSVISCLISLAMKWVKFTQIIHLTFHFRITASWNDRFPHLFFYDFILYTYLSSQNIIELNLGGMSLVPKESTQACLCRHTVLHCLLLGVQKRGGRRTIVIQSSQDFNKLWPLLLY